MKIKRTITSLLTAAMLATVLAGCQNTSEASKAQSTNDEQNSQATVTETTAPPDTYSDIDDMISKMTVEEKVGQLFYVNCRGNDMSDAINKYHIGGVLLFGVDFDGKTKEEVNADINAMQSNAKIPLIIGTDEEGGTVVRASDNPKLRDSAYLSPSDTFNNGGWSAIEDDAYDKAEFLLSLGVNVNMAPVCDITSDPYSFMYYRSFSSDAASTSRFVDTVVKASSELWQLYEEARNLDASMQEYKRTFQEQQDLTLLKQALVGGQISMIEYFVEVSVVYQSKTNLLQLENQYQKAMARIYKNEL